MFIVLRLEGLTMEEISEDIGEPSYKIRTSVRNKLQGLFDEDDTGAEKEALDKICQGV